MSAAPGPPAAPRFVVGTGRCGSTLLSLVLAAHRDVVSIHEFFTGLDWGRRFAPGDVGGTEVASIIAAEQPVASMAIARGEQAEEVVYPFGRPGARYARTDPVPWLCVSMLPRLTDDPDRWYDDLCAFAAALPPQPIARQYLAIFDWLCARAGGAVWIERSGSSLDYLADLVAQFPDARFVHIHRDGHEAALSIRAHPFFRLALAVLYDLFPAGMEEQEAVSHALRTPPPVSVAGRFWCDQVLHGYRALQWLDRDRYLEVRFEDLVQRPSAVVTELAAFFELPPDPELPRRAEAMVRGMPPSRFAELTPAEQAELSAACRPGQVLLGRS